jgi:hypothetical protein
MPQRKANGQFKKGHKAHHKKAHHKKSHHSSGAMIVRPTVVRVSGGKRKSHHGRRRHHGGGKMNLLHLAVAGAGLAYLTGSASPVQAIPQNIAKIPGSKTFGNAATAGLACLAIDRFVKRNKWLRAAGVIGVVLGAVQVGQKGADFKWLGDEDGGDWGGDNGSYDMEE